MTVPCQVPVVIVPNCVISVWLWALYLVCASLKLAFIAEEDMMVLGEKLLGMEIEFDGLAKHNLVNNNKLIVSRNFFFI
jgi:hypothetical protein